MVNSNLPRSYFPFIWGGQRVNSNLGGGQSWSTQICLDLIFPLFGRGSKLVNSNLPRSNFPFIWGVSKLVNSNLPRSNFPFIWGVSKLVNSNLPRSNFPFIWEGGWSTQICLDLILPLFRGVKVGQLKSA